jgi:hypothetical protein
MTRPLAAMALATIAALGLAKTPDFAIDGSFRPDMSFYTIHFHKVNGAFPDKAQKAQLEAESRKVTATSFIQFQKNKTYRWGASFGFTRGTYSWPAGAPYIVLVPNSPGNTPKCRYHKDSDTIDVLVETPQFAYGCVYKRSVKK